MGRVVNHIRVARVAGGREDKGVVQGGWRVSGAGWVVEPIVSKCTN